MNANIFEKLLYGLKVANDNIIVLNAKMDDLLNSLTYEGEEPSDVIGSKIEDIN